jgi:CRISPR system Cascade subunit CasD
VSVLILRLAGPLQSWGVARRHNLRGTLPYPSKSGVIGMLAAACGIPRGSLGHPPVTLTDLARLRLATRTDQPGMPLIDYHTVSGASHAPGTPDLQRLPTADDGRLKPAESTKITRRHYLTDAVFTAYLQGDPGLLTHVEQALQRPRYPLYLGRRSCPPAGPLLLALDHDTDLDQALSSTPWQAADHEHRRHRAGGHTSVDLDTVTEDPDGSDDLQDQPVPGAPAHRAQYTERLVRHGTVNLPLPAPTHGDPAADDAALHDPFALLD